MVWIRVLFCCILGMAFSACSSDDWVDTDQSKGNSNQKIDEDHCVSSVLSKGKVYISDDKTWLWAGEDSYTHFNITDWILDTCNLNFGDGREVFPALIDPEYEKISDVGHKYGNQENCILLHHEQNTLVYPYGLLTSYEVVNENVGDNPVMIAYCVLADLAAVYTRRYCNEVLTFGVSGYTYREETVWEGIQGFILWDRDTESLWWPLIDKAVSGEMKNTALVKYNERKWETMVWSEVIDQFPNALVLKKNQHFNPPLNWPKKRDICN